MEAISLVSGIGVEKIRIMGGKLITTKRLLVPLWALCIFATGVSEAREADALNWLAGQQNSIDGSIYLESDISNLDQSTAESIQALQLATEPNFDAETNSALGFLDTLPIEQGSTESLSRIISVKALANQNNDAELTELLLRQNSDGGFGDYQGYDSTTLSTAFALSALPLSGGGKALGAVNYLVNFQKGDGSWSLSGNGLEDSSVEVTAYAMSALWEYRNQLNLDSNISAVQGYLESLRQDSTELWGTREQSALSLIALTQNAVDRSPYQASVDNLTNQQLENGSYENDVYLTALIAKLEQIVKRPAADTISVSGRILDADSSFALPNVDVRLSGASNAQSNTNANGQFLVQAPVGGAYNLRLSLEGYSTAVLQTNLSAGEQLNLNDVVLSKLAINPETGAPFLTGTVRGTVKATFDDSPLSGVAVAINGQPELATVTDANGNYLISNVPGGNVTVTASLDGYLTGIGSAQLSTSQTLIFSPKLQQIIPNTVSVFGLVSDAGSDAPLENATVTVSQDANQYSAVTDSTGMYQITDIPGGFIQLSVTLDGYVEASGELDAPNGANVNFSPSLTSEGQQPTEKPGALKARIVDRLTGQALGDVGLTLTYVETAQTFSFSINGGEGFELLDLPLGNVVLELTSPGYTPDALDIEVLDSVNLDLGIISLLPIGANTDSSVTGFVVNSTTNEPLADVIVSIGTQNILTGQNGEFTFNNVTSGETNLIFQKEEFNTIDISILVATGQDVDLAQLRMRPTSADVLMPDLSVTGLNSNNLSTNLRTLEVSGDLIVEVSNLGTQNVESQFELIVFKDLDGDEEYESGVDEVLGQIVSNDPINVDTVVAVVIPVSGNLDFRDAPVHVKVDSNTVVIEADESNNVRSTAQECSPRSRCSDQVVPLGAPKVKWAWTGSDIEPGFNQVLMTPLVAQASDDNDDGVIDESDTPDIIFMAHAVSTLRPGFASGIIRIISGEDGTDIRVINPSGAAFEAYGSLAVGDIDNDGEIEILAPGKDSGVYAFELDGTQKWYQPNMRQVRWGGITLADLDGDGVPEVLAAGAALDNNGNVLWEGDIFQGQFSGEDHRGIIPIAADVTLDGFQEVIYGGTVYNHDGSLLWQNSTVSDGLTGIGNFDEDQNPEIAVVREGFVNLLDDDGTLLWRVATLDGGEGGAPAIADFDGDGSADIGVAGSTLYVVYRNDGSILWQSSIFDQSSRATGASVFDFNNDGMPEVVYADQKSLYVFNGLTGETIFEEPSSSATTYEYPVIADIDNDGHAEIVVAQNNAIASSVVGPVSFNGIRVYEEENDSWVGTRGIWNQHAYSIDNVNDNGSIPSSPVNGWLTHNTFRLNAFPECSAADPVVKWRWGEDSLEGVYGPVNVGQFTDDNGDGVINTLDNSDVLFISRNSSNQARLNLVDGDTGEQIWRITNLNITTLGSTAIADIDGDGVVEIIVPDRTRRNIYALEHTGAVKWLVPTGPTKSNIPRDGVAIADLDGDGSPEIVHGRNVFSADGVLLWTGTAGSGDNSDYGFLPLVADIDLDGSPDVVAGHSVYEADGQIKWDRDDLTGDGYTAIGNFDDDDFAEIVLVASSMVYLLEHDGQTKWGPISIPGGGTGGAPTVADLDGDGEVEIGVAGAQNYVVFETDGSIKWASRTKDESSNRTGSSAFDFDDDGSVEIVYADEEFIRIYDGATGNINFQLANGSGTTLEYPVIVDVDGDNHAELIFGSTTIRAANIGNGRGLRVIEAVDDSWANTRRIWNQHTYHISNINDDGTVPAVEEPSWLTHNTYRLNTFLGLSASALSDLTVSRLSVIDGGVGQPFTVSARVGNGGALPSRRDVELSFYKITQSGERELIAQRVLEVLEEGDFSDVVISDVTGLAMGDRIIAIVDDVDSLEECDETNNTMSISVGAISGGVGVVTDKPSYSSDELVVITNSVRNTSSFSNSYEVSTRIEDASGQLVTEFATEPTGLLLSDSIIELQLNWNTAANLSGAYAVVSLLIDQNANTISEGRTDFTIVSENVDGLPNITLRTITDRNQYNINDSVEIDDLVRNISVNALEPAATLQVSVTAPSGIEVFNATQSIGDMTPNFSNQFIDLLELSNAELGDYQVVGTVLSVSDAVLATDSAVFEVVNNLTQTILGSVTVSSDQIFIGESLSCADILNNDSSNSVADLPIRQLLLNVDASELISMDQSVESILANGELVLDPRMIPTDDLAIGNYSCALQAYIDDEWVSLDNEFFEVLEQTIEIDLVASIGDKGRILILLDDSMQCTDDPSGPHTAPNLVDQQQFLESLLDGAGWSYTITQNTTDFTRELRTGGYSIYMLMSELSNIQHFVQKEVREAVYRGEGLIEAGKRIQPYQVVNQAHGILHRGIEQHATGIDIVENDLSGLDSVALTHRDKNVRITAQSAKVVAEYMGGTGSESSHHRGRHYHGYRYFSGHNYTWCPPVQNTSPAITLNEFGLGMSVFMGFDLLIEAVSMGAIDSVFTDLLLNALETVNPVPPLTTVGTDYPVVFTVTNVGAATPATFVLPIPADISVVDAGEGIIDEATQSISWALALSEGQVVDIPIWVEMPDMPTLLTGVVNTGEGGAIVERATASIELIPEVLISIDDVIEVTKHAHSLRKVKQSLLNARRHLDKSHSQSALRSLLIASSHVAKIQQRYQSENLSALRINIDLLVKQVAKQLVVSTPRHRCVMRGQWGNYNYPREFRRCGGGHDGGGHQGNGGGYGHH